MNTMLAIRPSAVAVALLFGLAAGAGSAVAQGPAAPASSIQGVWKNADTTIRVAVNGKEARGLFVEVGQGAKALGFKPGDVSFVGAVDGTHMHGEQTIRYGGTCHPNGRKVPMIGKMTADGKALAMHNYNLVIDGSCRDTGEYGVTETLWQRQAAR